MTTTNNAIDRNSKIYVAGHRGMVGSAIVRRLNSDGYANIIAKTHAELDLTEQSAVAKFFRDEKPDYVFLAAARVGGIHANNTYRAEFIYPNLMMEANGLNAARRSMSTSARSRFRATAPNRSRKSIY